MRARALPACSNYQTWIVAEFCDRGSLHSLLAGGRWGGGEAGQRHMWALLCLLDISMGLDYLHLAAIVSPSQPLRLPALHAAPGSAAHGSEGRRATAAAAPRPSRPARASHASCPPINPSTRPPTKQVHGDLKPANVMLKTARNDRRGFVCK